MENIIDPFTFRMVAGLFCYGLVGLWLVVTHTLLKP